MPIKKIDLILIYGWILRKLSVVPEFSYLFEFRNLVFKSNKQFFNKWVKENKFYKSIKYICYIFVKYIIFKDLNTYTYIFC